MQETLIKVPLFCRIYYNYMHIIHMMQWGDLAAFGRPNSYFLCWGTGNTGCGFLPMYIEKMYLK